MKLLATVCSWLIGLSAVGFPLYAAPLGEKNASTALPAFGRYFPEASTSAGFLPPVIKRKVEDYLRREFPATVVSRIEFRSGCAVDLAKAALAGTQTTVRYSLIYGVPIKQGAFQWFEFRLDLDESGSVILTDNIPRAARARKFEFLPEATMLDIARARLATWAEVRVMYLSDRDVVVWQFTKWTKRFLLGEYHEVLLIDATSGKVVDQYGYKPMN